jgi:hypothetical protein
MRDAGRVNGGFWVELRWEFVDGGWSQPCLIPNYLPTITDYRLLTTDY